LKEWEIDTSPFSAPIPRKPNREVHWAKPELVADIEMTSWTQDAVSIGSGSLRTGLSRPILPTARLADDAVRKRHRFADA
jgi:hypothetical protein